MIGWPQSTGNSKNINIYKHTLYSKCMEQEIKEEKICNKCKGPGDAWMVLQGFYLCIPCLMKFRQGDEL